MQESITQELLAGVLAGQTLYENFVGETRARLDSGADIERGPLTVDFEALRAEGVPLRIIVPTPGFRFHGGLGGGFNNGPLGNFQNFISLLDKKVGREQRRCYEREYREYLYRYGLQGELLRRTRRVALSAGMSAETAGLLVCEAITFHWTILRFHVAGLLYRYGISMSTAISHMIPATTGSNWRPVS